MSLAIYSDHPYTFMLYRPTAKARQAETDAATAYAQAVAGSSA